MQTMIDTEILNEKFGIEGEIGFSEMDGDLVYLNISNKYADADICLYGAHVVSFRPIRTMEMLWVSPEANYEVGKAIRGGIPVCFPWFGPHATDSSKPQHGFGRLMYWDVLKTEALDNGETKVELALHSSEATKAYWPYDFEAVMHFTIGAKLSVTLEVKNCANEPFQLSNSLHSYFAVSDLEHVQIEGLKDLTYFNQLKGGKETQLDSILEISEGMTRHYLNTESTVTLADAAFRRRIVIEKEGSKVTTVWNPGAAASISDIPEGGFANFVCIEATNAFDYGLQLAPGATHKTTQTFGLEE